MISENLFIAVAWLLAISGWFLVGGLVYTFINWLRKKL